MTSSAGTPHILLEMENLKKLAGKFDMRLFHSKFKIVIFLRRGIFSNKVTNKTCVKHKNVHLVQFSYFFDLFS